MKKYYMIDKFKLIIRQVMEQYNNIEVMSYELQRRQAFEGRKKQEQTAEQKEQEQEKSPCFWAFLSVFLYLLAVVIYVCIWASNKYGNLYVQTSYYYTVSSPISTFLGSTATSSTTIFSNLKSIQPVALSLVYSWVLWKFSLVVFTFIATGQQSSLCKRITSTLIVFFVLLTIDILGTVFLLDIYQEGLFFLIASFVVPIAVIPNSGYTAALKNVFVPLMYLGGVLVTVSLLLPSLYNVYMTNMSNEVATTLIIYLWPLFDLVFYCLLLVINNTLDPDSRRFVSSFQFLLVGLELGMALLAGYTEVQFYYLIIFYALRNVFTNRVMRKWETVVNNPLPLFLWPILYYGAIVLNYLPLIGVGKLVVSQGFYSPYFSRSIPLIYSVPNPNYLSSTYVVSEFNTSFNTNTFWLSALIFWLASTLSQQFPRTKPNLTDIFIYLFAFQLFFLGLTCGISAIQLAVFAHI